MIKKSKTRQGRGYSGLAKVMTIMALLLSVSTGAWADETVTFDYSDYKGQGTQSSGSEYTMDKTDVSITESKFYCGETYSNAQFYANGVATVTPAEGVTIKKVVITATSDSYNGYQNNGTITASTGEISANGTTITWTGSATAAFTLSHNKQIRWSTIVVTYEKAAQQGGSGEEAQDAKHLITATHDKTRSLEQPLPYATTIGEFYEAVTGESFSSLISTMSLLDMPLTGISSTKTDVVSIGELNGASTPVTVKADGKATISISFGNFVKGIFVNVVSPLYAYVKDGVKDAYKWTVKVGEGQAQALPIGGLKGDGSETVTLQYNGRLKVKGVKATSDAAPAATTYTLLSAATTSDYGKVVCAAGHLHDAKTAVPDGCTAVGILGMVTDTGHGLILALQDAKVQNWDAINVWTSVTTYAGTTLKVLPDDAARSNLTSYTALGETAVSNWAVAQKGDYEAIFINLGSTKSDSDGTTYDANVNAYITTGVGGTALTDGYWSATEVDHSTAWFFDSDGWIGFDKYASPGVRPVLGF